MIRRLRALPDLNELYQQPHDHRRYGHDHAVRVDVTSAIGVWLAQWKGCRTGADLSCGNAAISDEIEVAAGTEFVRGDYAPGYELTGPLEENLSQIDHVDLFVCCETLEHLDDPGLALQLIRAKADLLLLSTPVHRPDALADTNGEHLWMWDQTGVWELFYKAGWDELAYAETAVVHEIGGVYTYGIWALEGK